MSLDPEFLSRLQFGFTIMFHYLFPPLSIGLGVLMVLMEGMYLRTGDRHYEAIARFWTRIFAVNFAMGVATGIVMEFQFGTNWSRYARYVGDVFGSALAAEGIFASFLVMSIAAYYVVTRQHQVLAGKMFTLALLLGTAASLGAPAFGHLQADIVAHHQPAKLAALEGHYKTGPGTLYLFGMPND